MRCTALIQGHLGVLKLEGRFTFEDHQEFKLRGSEMLSASGLTALRLDFSALSYLDSNALGMLLLLREKAKARNLEIVLVNPSPAVKDILDMVQFGSLFHIENGPLP